MKKWFKRTYKFLKKHISSLHRTISYVKRRTGYTRIYIFFDILRCYILYSSTYDEYRIFEFFIVHRRIENTYLTKVRHDDLSSYLYNRNNLEIFKDRREFYKRFNNFLKRDTCYSKNLSFKQSEELILKNKQVVCKSILMKEEKTEVLNLYDFRSAAYLLQESEKNKLPILEESVKQHPLLEEINPNNLNILSVVTLKYDGVPEVIAATLKFGTSESYQYDYKKSDYISGYVNIDTGKITHKYRSRNGRVFTHHPISKIKVTDIEVPNFEKAKKAALKCAKLMNESLEVEWNFAITKNNVCLMGANLWGDYIFSQIPEYLGKKVGLMPYYNSHVNKSKKL